MKPPEVFSVALEKPYLILVGDETDVTNAKTGIGIANWRPGDVAGQFRFSNEAVDLGVPDLGIDAGVASLVSRSVVSR